jgi:uncharacterized RDD family membrane protein YckC
MTLRNNLLFVAGFPDEGVEDEHDFVEYPGRIAAEILQGVLRGLGCEVEPLFSADMKGWEFQFRFEGRGFWSRVTVIECHYAVFVERGLGAALGRGDGGPALADLLARLDEALSQDPRFSQLRWYAGDEIGNAISATIADGRSTPEPPPPPDRPADPSASDRAGHPFRRWIARQFDFMVTTALVLLPPAAALLVFGDAAAAGWVVLAVVYFASPLRALLAAFLNAYFLSAMNVTPGKWLCGLRVERTDGGRLGYGLALRRELEVLIVGCGLYLPLLNLITMGAAFSWLRTKGASSWDGDRGLVSLHRPGGPGQTLLTATAFGLWVLTLISAYGVLALFAHNLEQTQP